LLNFLALTLVSPFARNLATLIRWFASKQLYCILFPLDTVPMVSATDQANEFVDVGIPPASNKLTGGSYDTDERLQELLAENIALRAKLAELECASGSISDINGSKSVVPQECDADIRKCSSEASQSDDNASTVVSDTSSQYLSDALISDDHSIQAEVIASGTSQSEEISSTVISGTSSLKSPLKGALISDECTSSPLHSIASDLQTPLTFSEPEGLGRWTIRKAFASYILLGLRLLGRGHIGSATFLQALSCGVLSSSQAPDGLTGVRRNILKFQPSAKSLCQNFVDGIDLVAIVLSTVDNGTRSSILSLVPTFSAWQWAFSTEALRSLSDDQQTMCVRSCTVKWLTCEICTALRGEARALARANLAPFIGRLSLQQQNFMRARY
jgi:hypothetical protein